MLLFTIIPLRACQAMLEGKEGLLLLCAICYIQTKLNV